MIGVYKKIFFLLFGSKKIQGILHLDLDGLKYKIGNEITTDKDGKIHSVDIQIRDNRFFERVILFGDIGFGEAYFKNYFTSSDLGNLLKWFIQNKECIPGFSSQKLVFIFFEWARLFSRVSHFLNKNTKNGSRENIKKHYDVSNDFYHLWLDKTMAYSSAVFDEGLSLEEAQINKYRKICEKIELNKDDHILEIGSGWGGFSIFAVKNYRCKVTTVTISKEQFDFVKTKIDNEGLGNSIEIRLEDYRDIKGQYDKIVSIEMMEALGHEYVPTFVKKCNDLIRRGGKIFYQCITFPDDRFQDYLKNNNYIKKYIFPGGELISIAQLEKEILYQEKLHILDIQSIGIDYAKTLNIWRRNYIQKKEEIMKLGFDEEFYRKWLYYLIYCEVGFETKYLDDVQIVIQKD